MSLGNILGQILQQGMSGQGRSRLDHAVGAGGIGDLLGGLLGGQGGGGGAAGGGLGDLLGAALGGGRTNAGAGAGGLGDLLGGVLGGDAAMRAQAAVAWVIYSAGRSAALRAAADLRGAADSAICLAACWMAAARAVQAAVRAVVAARPAWPFSPPSPWPR